MENIGRAVVDISVLEEGILSSKISQNQLVVQELIIPNFVLNEIERCAYENRISGEIALEEVNLLKALSQEKRFTLNFLGNGLRKEEYLIDKTRELAWEEGAVLITSNRIQALSSKAKGVQAYLISEAKENQPLNLETFFDQQTMSVHLREGTIARAKKGTPGNWKIAEIGQAIITRRELLGIRKEIVEKARMHKNSFVEIERLGSLVVQLEDYRIVITEPPFSDGMEITAVRPVRKLSLEDYALDQKLKQKLTEEAAGIIIAGSPGEGKTTFARALAEHFADSGNIVKTVESPRDMLLKEEITQYSLTRSEKGEIHDVLLLSRPDRTFFDEMRNSDDFIMFADLRLAGIGMIGVVHATNPIDAIQRCIGRIELGIIPQVVDTVIFIQGGKVAKVLELKMLVKVPTGMVELDLARPVIEVKDFMSGKLAYEIYSYGEHTAVIPVEKTEKKKVWSLAEKQLKEFFNRYSQNNEVVFVSDNHIKLLLPEDKIAGVIGTGGREIEKIENQLGIKIDVEKLGSDAKEISYELEKDNSYLIFYLDRRMKEKEIGLFEGEDLLVQARASKKAVIKLQRRSALGKAVEQALNEKRLNLYKVL